MNSHFRSARRFFLAALTSLLLASPVMAQQPASGVTVFAAASLKNALDEVGSAYTAKTGKAVRLSYAASSALARQIDQGAPADIFISADSDWMDDVASKGLIVAASRRNLLTNHLALIAPTPRSRSASSPACRWRRLWATDGWLWPARTFRPAATPRPR